MSEQVEDFPRDEAHRFRLYRLCDCDACGGSGKETAEVRGTAITVRCTLCRGEGKVRDCLAAAEDPEGLGIALVTLGREGEFVDCAMGILDVLPPCETCNGSGEDLNWLEGVRVKCFKCKGSGVKPTGTWIVKPWLPSPRNVSDAGRVLASGRKAT